MTELGNLASLDVWNLPVQRISEQISKFDIHWHCVRNRLRKTWLEVERGVVQPGHLTANQVEDELKNE